MTQASISSNAVPLPSNRAFGWTFVVVFALLALFHPGLLIVSAAIAVVTLARAEWLAPLNRAWMKLGAAMHRVVSPVIMAVMFFGVFTPMGWVMRRFGWDAMRRSYDAAAKSYWIRRDPAGPADDSYRNLF